MSKAQQEKYDKIAASLEKLTADVRDLKSGVNTIKSSVPTSSAINTAIKNFGFGRSITALNVGFDLSELKVMMSLFGFNHDFCSDMFVSFLDKKHAPLLRMVKLLYWKLVGREFEPNGSEEQAAVFENLEREASEAFACAHVEDETMNKVIGFHNQALQFRKQNSTVAFPPQTVSNATTFFSSEFKRAATTVTYERKRKRAAENEPLGSFTTTTTTTASINNSKRKQQQQQSSSEQPPAYQDQVEQYDPEQQQALVADIDDNLMNNFATAAHDAMYTTFRGPEIPQLSSEFVEHSLTTTTFNNVENVSSTPPSLY